jgi:hypothetical protein
MSTRLLTTPWLTKNLAGAELDTADSLGTRGDVGGDIVTHEEGAG